jgi:hypothetical protein
MVCVSTASANYHLCQQGRFVSVVSLIILITFTGFGLIQAHAVEVFPVNSNPLEVPYNEWVKRYWNWWMTVSQEDIDGSQCLINKSDKMVMLMEPDQAGVYNYRCSINSTQGIIVPVFIGWCDTSPDNEGNVQPINQLLQCARDANSGEIDAVVKVNGTTIAELHVDNYNPVGPNGKVNIQELTPEDFELRIEEDSYKVQQGFTKAGPWKASSFGWWAFIEPLQQPGKYEIYYYAQRVAETTTVREITYDLDVR